MINISEIFPLSSCCENNIVIVNNDLIVSMEIPDYCSEDDRNIWRIALDGTVKWKIDPQESGPYEFTDVKAIKGDIVAYSAQKSAQYTVNPESGRIAFRRQVPYLG